MLKRMNRYHLGALIAAASVAAALAVPGAAFATTDLEYDPTGNPVADNPTRVEVNKLEEGSDSKLVAGAHLQILDENGKVVADWVSDGKASFVLEQKLDVDKLYTLHEVSAPEGYEVAEDVSFVLQSEDFETKGVLCKKDGTPYTADELRALKNVKMSEVTGDAANQAFIIGMYDAVTTEGERHVSGSRTSNNEVKSNLAKTGDDTNLGLIAGLAAGGAVVVGVGIYRKRKSDEK